MNQTARSARPRPALGTPSEVPRRLAACRRDLLGAAAALATELASHGSRLAGVEPLDDAVRAFVSTVGEAGGWSHACAIALWRLRAAVDRTSHEQRRGLGDVWRELRRRLRDVEARLEQLAALHAIADMAAERRRHRRPERKPSGVRGKLGSAR